MWWLLGGGGVGVLEGLNQLFVSAEVIYNDI